MTNKSLTLSKRLAAAAEYARAGSFIADIGTDHAYLPIHLYLSGRIRGAVASDIGEGPAERALINIRKYGLEKKITVNIADGLRGIDAFLPDDIFILGMGGELIVDILSHSDLVRSSTIRLVLQPMTHPEILRAYLASEGFNIIDERIIIEDKLYQLIVAEYHGRTVCEYTPAELLLGRINIKRGGEDVIALAKHWKTILEKRDLGRALSRKQTDGSDAGEDSLLLGEITEILSKLTN